MSSEATGFTIADDGTFHAPLVLSYPYKRTMGPTMSRFLIGLRDQRIEGTVGSDGTIYVPPAEFDPITGQALSEWRTVADEGTVLSWSWQPTVDDASPLSRPFAWALIKLDGADTPLLHAVEVESPEAIGTGTRVKVRWSDERKASMHDIVAFRPVAAGTATAPGTATATGAGAAGA